MASTWQEGESTGQWSPRIKKKSEETLVRVTASPLLFREVVRISLLMIQNDTFWRSSPSVGVNVVSL